MKNRKVSFPVASLALALGVAAYALVGCSGTEAPPPGEESGTGGAVSGAGGAGPTGGVAQGGVATGGVAQGGVVTGGVATGGAATGGVATGGVATGGVATGGAATGGVATGGVATGGSGGDGMTGGSSGAGMTGGSSGAGMTGGSGGQGMGGSAGSGTAGTMGTGGASTDNKNSGPDTMGWLGCSMGENVAIGYRRIGGTRMWGSNGNGGAVVQQWTSNNSPAWQRFDQKKGNTTLAAVWIMICIFTSGATDSEIDALVRNARSHAPGAYIYITGQPTYPSDYTCSLAGPGGPELTDRLAQAAAMRHADVHYAGTFGPLNANERQEPCHANTTGEDKLGRQAKEKFGQP